MLISILGPQNTTMKNVIIIALLLLSSTVYSQQIIPEKERAKVIDDILKDRFDQLLPSLMDETEIDMWIVISREYNEDPVLRTMLPATWLNARRRTILLFYREQIPKQYREVGRGPL